MGGKGRWPTKLDVTKCLKKPAVRPRKCCQWPSVQFRNGWMPKYGEEGDKLQVSASKTGRVKGFDPKKTQVFQYLRLWVDMKEPKFF